MLLGCTSSSETAPSDTFVDSLYISNNISTPVDVYISKNEVFNYKIITTGKLIAKEKFSGISEVSGTVKVCNLRTGQFVSKGDVLAVIDDIQIGFRLEKAQQTKYNALMEYESQLLGYSSLLLGTTSGQVDTIKKKLNISTGLAAADLELKEAKHEQSKYIITAPINGILFDVKIVKGENLKPGHELFNLYNPRNLMLQVKILESELSYIKLNAKSFFSTIGNPGHEYTAFIEEINPFVDEGGMINLGLRVSDQQLNSFRLLPGMNCTAYIQIPKKVGLIIPKDAVIYRSAKAVVFTFENGHAKWNYVTVGNDDGKNVEILTGLKEGQSVIVSNNLQLSNDAPVVIRSSKK